MFIKCLELCHDVKIVSRIESDHLPVVCRLGSKRKLANANVENKKITKYIWDESKATVFKDELSNEESRQEINIAFSWLTSNINTSINVFNKTLLNAAGSMRVESGSGGIKKENKPWFDSECREAKKEARHALTKVRMLEYRNGVNQVLKMERLANYKDSRARYQKLLNKKKTEHNQNLFDKLIQNFKDSSSFWGIIKSLKSNKQSIPDIDLKEWEEHFREVLNPAHLIDEGNNQVNIEQIRNREIIVEELDRDFEKEEVIKATHNLKAKKAAGDDGVIPELLKNLIDDAINYILNLLNSVYNEGIYPDEWSSAIIVPIFKKGDKSNPSNYRGISLLNILSKIYTAILNERL